MSIIRPRPLVLLVAGQVFSKLAVALYLLSMTLYIRGLDGGAALLGLLQFLSLAPIVVLSPVAASLADMSGRKAILLVSDAGRGVVLLALAMLLFISAHATPALGIAAVLLTALLVGIGQATFQPAADAFLPDLVPASALGPAVAVRGACVQTANLAGNAVGGLIFLSLGATGSTTITAALFLVSAAWETLLPEPAVSDKKPKTSPRRPNVPRLLKRLGMQTRIGLRFARRTRGLPALLIMNLFFHASFPILLIALPFFLEFELALGPQYLGYSFAALLAGGITGYILLALFRIKLGHRVLAALVGLTAPALWLLALTADTVPRQLSVPLYFCALVLAGMAAAGGHLIVHTAIGVAVRRNFRARVYGLLEASTGAAAAFGFLLAGPLLDLLMDRLPSVLMTLGFFGLILAIVPLQNRSIRGFLLLAKV
ncbi:MAG: MFS transporter [Spirochaetia bacterium]